MPTFRLLSLVSCALSLGLLLTACSASAETPRPSGTSNSIPRTPPSRVVIIHHPAATEAFKPDATRVRTMVEAGLTNLAKTTNLAAAWLTFVSPQDIVGIKVFSAPGADAGTRPAVVAAVIEGLLAAKLPTTNIIIWDRQRSDLRKTGYTELSAHYSVALEGSANIGFEETVFYSPERPILGQLVWGDVEFGRKGEGVGRRSYVTRLLTRQITKVINISC